jgi:hypothetical protein
MPRTFTDLPPDHPIFSIGPSFVFAESQPPDVEEDDEMANDSQTEDE